MDPLLSCTARFLAVLPRYPTRVFPCILRTLVCVLLLSPAGASATDTGSGDASLPSRLSTDPDLCAHVPCREVLPTADRFSSRKGRPSYVDGYRMQNGRSTLVGYVFLSTDVVDIVGYSGKPIVTLVGMDTHGVITGVRVLRHGESVLRVGIPASALERFAGQYVGKFVGDRIVLGSAPAAERRVAIDAISGATVTSVVENQAILRASHRIAEQVGILKVGARPTARLAPLADMLDWKALVAEGAVVRLTIEPGTVGEKDTGEPFIDLYFGYLGAPVVGRSILGEEGYRRLMSELQAGEHAIFVIARGVGSFKGSGFARGGIFERIQISQGTETFVFRDTDYRNLYEVRARGAPQYRESGIFILRDAEFHADRPWSLVFLASRLDKQSGVRSFLSIDSQYRLPRRYLEGGG